MASESTSSQQSSHLSPSSKVNFKCEEGIIAYNNAVALLKHPNVLYHPMLRFLSNCCISTALTRQPSATYVEYLKEFWYTKETIAYSLIWGMEIDIGGIIFPDLIHKLQNRKKNMEENICYTRYLSLISEELLGENYINDDLTFVKPYTISAASFQTPLASEVSLTSHMLKVAKLFQEPEQSLILSYEKVNADDGADKVILPKKQVAETQHAEEPVATADATKSLGASESAAEQVQDQNVQEEVNESGLESIEDVTFDQIMDEIDQKTNGDPSLHYKFTFSTNKFMQVQDQNVQEEVKESGLESIEDVTFDQIMHEIDQKNKDAKNAKNDEEGDASDSGLWSMPDDDLASLTGFETPDSADDDSKEGTGETFYASADMPAQSDPLGPLHEELRILNTKIDKLESNITKKVTDDVQSSMPSITTSSIFSPTPPRESTPPRDESKGKGIATEEPLKDLMPYIKKGGSVLKMPKLKSFITSDGQLTPKDTIAQVKEMKRLADLKAKKEKLEESLKRIMNPRADELPIMKISYRVNSYKEATIRITRANDPLNVTMHERFRLKTLGFSEWLKVHSLASKTKSILPPPELSTFNEVFMTKDIVVDGMHRRKGLVIREPESGIFFYNGNFDLVFSKRRKVPPGHHCSVDHTP
ncbi:hypothetical protein Tco_0908904 [Tanacetum coccineum]|uniref:Uncharacterized protein n=1 Tax=Tanacetum coccineum TaxID=301880 RepID=A0ABQ5CV03_9ASTR